MSQSKEAFIQDSRPEARGSGIDHQGISDYEVGLPRSFGFPKRAS